MALLRHALSWLGRAAAVAVPVVASSLAVALALPSGVAQAQQSPLAEGISPGASWQYLSNAQLTQAVSGVAATGAGWVRIDLDWPAIQNGPGAFDWSLPDRVIRSALSHGLKVDALPTYTPSWAAAWDGSPDPNAFATFVTQAARRYSPMGVHTYEIWNEPNLNNTWGPRVSPAEYANLLRAGYPAIKSVDPSATVVTAGLAPAADAPDGSSMEPLTFLTQLYAYGAKGYFDAVGSHPYTYPDMPMQPDSWNPFVNLPLIRQLMVNNGDSAKKVWITEYGAPTAGSGAVSEDAQAQMVSQAFSAVRAWPWVGALFVFDWQDNASDGAFGLLRSDGSAKPALASFTAGVAQQPPPGPPPPPVGQYSTVWVNGPSFQLGVPAPAVSSQGSGSSQPLIAASGTSGTQASQPGVAGPASTAGGAAGTSAALSAPPGSSRFSIGVGPRRWMGVAWHHQHPRRQQHVRN